MAIIYVIRTAMHDMMSKGGALVACMVVVV